MKFITVALLITTLVGMALSGVAPIPKDLQRCNYICQKTDPLVCATNGICLNRFSSLCEMQIFNCLNPKDQFKQVPDHSCKESWAPICTRGDFHDIINN